MKTVEETERIVLEVIRRLTSAKPDAIPNSTTDTGALLINDRVITLATLEDRLEGVRKIVVQPRAVVTPAVHDELRSNNIQLVRQSQPVGNPTSPRLIVASPGSTLLAADLIGDLAHEVTTVGQASLEAAILNMTDLLTENALGVICTQQPEAAACLANRHHHVHAFVGHGNDSVQRAATTMEANLLVLDASSSPSAAKDMLRIFTSGHGKGAN